MMWDEIINLAISNGIFAVMFLGLLMYELKDSSKREKKYQETLDKLSNGLNHLCNVEDDLKCVRNDIEDIKTDIKIIKNKVLPLAPTKLIKSKKFKAEVA